MKKIFTLTTALLLALSASADNVSKRLGNTLVFYMTSDCVTSAKQIVENDDGEEEEVEAPLYWRGADMTNAFNFCGIPLGGASTTQIQYQVTTRRDYKDAETGFEMPAGSYRGIFVDGTMDFTGALGEDKVVGYSNIKSVVLFFVPIPNYWKKTGTFSHQDYPTGRVQARYVDEAGAALTNQAYREIHINQTESTTEGDADKSTALLNFWRDPVEPLKITVDQPYKLTINLQNLKDGKDYEDVFANATTKQSEFANFVCPDESTEAEMSYYFAKTGTSHYSYDNPASGDAATGYDCPGGKWGEKMAWTPETIVQLQVKKRLYLVGAAFVSATDGAASKFMNAHDGMAAKWSSDAKAFGEHHAFTPDGITTVATNAPQTADRSYNLAGQAVGRDYKGVVIRGGKKMIQQ